VLPLAMLGCGQGDPGELSSPTVDTLPNGAVRVANAPEGLWANGGGWRLELEMVLGEAEGAEALMFSAISGLQADEQGRIHVLDQHVNELRTFSSGGVHLRTVGRSGEGPGEYRSANGLLLIAPDTLLVVDHRGARYSVLTTEGEYVRSVVREMSFFGTFRGGYDGGRVFEEFALAPGTDDPRPIFLTVDLRTNGAGRVGPPGMAAAASRPSMDTVPLPVTAGPLYGEQFILYRDGLAAGFFRVPFSAAAVYRLDGRGGVWHGHGSEFRIIHTALEGDTVMEVLLNAAPAPVTATAIAEWEADEEETIQRWRQLGGTIELDRIPEARPFFDDIYVDPDGYLWVSVPERDTDTNFRVFDPGGRYLGRIELRGLQRINWVPPVVLNDRLYLVGRDELDIERVYVYEIER
jgi:hypothetical protein